MAVSISILTFSIASLAIVIWFLQLSAATLPFELTFTLIISVIIVVSIAQIHLERSHLSVRIDDESMSTSILMVAFVSLPLILCCFMTCPEVLILVVLVTDLLMSKCVITADGHMRIDTAMISDLLIITMAVVSLIKLVPGFRPVLRVSVCPIVRVGVVEGLQDSVLVEVNRLDVMLLIVGMIQFVMSLMVSMILSVTVKICVMAHEWLALLNLNILVNSIVMSLNQMILTVEGCLVRIMRGNVRVISLMESFVMLFLMAGDFASLMAWYKTSKTSSVSKRWHAVLDVFRAVMLGANSCGVVEDGGLVSVLGVINNMLSVLSFDLMQVELGGMHIFLLVKSVLRWLMVGIFVRIQSSS